MSVTLIAKKAGVSMATVSRVLNRSRVVTPDIAQRVRTAMSELKLQPNEVRLRPRTRKCASTLALVSVGQAYRDWFSTGVMASIVHRITLAAQDLGYGVLLSEMLDPSQPPGQLEGRDVSGALAFVSGEMNSRSTSVLRNRLPVVRVMGGELDALEVDQVGVDNQAVGYMAAEYLLKQGVSQMFFLANSPQWGFNRLRFLGFQAAAESAKLKPSAYLCGGPEHSREWFGSRAVCETSMQSLVSRVAENLKSKTGLFVTRDVDTVVVQRHLTQHGLRLGEDVVIVSCDNDESRLSTLFPRPASIELGTAEVAHRAVRRLMTRIKYPHEQPVRILVSPRLTHFSEEPDPGH